MDAHPSNEDVQRQGCAALWSLAANSGPGRKAAADAGGMERACSAMQESTRARPAESGAGEIGRSVGRASCDAQDMRCHPQLERTRGLKSKRQKHMVDRGPTSRRRFPPLWIGPSDSDPKQLDTPHGR